MLNVMEDITSMAGLRENLDEIMARVKEDGGPLVITEDGEAALVLLSAEEYQSLVGRSETQEMMAIATERAGDVTDLEDGIALFYKEAGLQPPDKRR